MNTKPSSFTTLAAVAAALLGSLSSASAQTNYLAVSGTTSVRLDTATLASAASLNLSGASSEGTPFDGTFQVGFPFVAGTNFVFSVETGFAPVGGGISHAGTVTFNQGTAQQVVLGDFRIGFDPGRIGDSRSGFFVQNTVAPLGEVILFDIANDLAPAFSPAGQFGVTNARLLVSSELGGFLLSSGFSTSNLTGAQVGEARIDGSWTVNQDATRPEISVQGPKTVRTSARVARIRGQAADDTGVARVEFKAGKGGFRRAAGRPENWRIRVVTGERPVRVKIRSVDAFGNRSPVQKIRVVRN